MDMLLFGAKLFVKIMIHFIIVPKRRLKKHKVRYHMLCVINNQSNMTRTVKYDCNLKHGLPSDLFHLQKQESFSKLDCVE